MFTLLIKIILLPVTLYTHQNSLKMVSLMPSLNRLQVKYYGDKDTIAEETQRLYKQEGYHPILSTIPMFIQLALLIGIIGAVRELLTGTESLLSVYPSQLGGINLLMPLAAGGSALLLGLAQNRFNPLQREQAKASQWMTNGLSIGISLMLGAFVPMGVGVYWITSNLLTIPQQLLLNAIMPPKKYVDYDALRESKAELDKLNALSAKVSPEDKRREKADYKRFFSIANKHLVFYSEKSGFYKYFADVIEYLLTHSNLTIHYITSDPKDAIFQKAEQEPRIKPYYIGENRFITLMMKMDADLVVMTMPDLDNFHIKRSYLRKDIEYIYMFHWVTSTHMIIREGAFDHFDTVLCPGPCQMAELRRAEELYGTPPKNLVDVGYGLIETLERQYQQMEHREHDRPQILIGPSWQLDNIMDSAIDRLLEQLAADGTYRVIVRPHPEYIKRFPQRMEAFQQRYRDKIGAAFELELDFSSNASVYESDLLITDWSNVGYEFAFATGKPVLFIDTPPKVTNPNYEKLGIPPLDLTLRDRVGKSLGLDELEKTGETAMLLLSRGAEYREEIFRCRKEILPQYGHSGEIGGKYILSRLVKPKLAWQTEESSEKEGVTP
jgi:YidC/Oxa1 family membrane protein insertase